MSFETFSALYFVLQRTLHLLTFEPTKEMVVKVILTFFFLSRICGKKSSGAILYRGK